MIQDPFPAHIRNDGTVQSVSEHCRGAAAIAGADLKGVSLNNTGYLAGLLHDLGKYTDEFRNYITRAAQGEKVVRGSVNHTFSGTRFIFEHYRDRAEVLDVLTKDLIGYAVGGHHEPFDCVKSDGSNGFQYRCEKEGIHYSKAVQSFETHCAAEEELTLLYEKSQREISEKIEEIKAILNTTETVQQQMGELAYYCGILARLVQSAVVDGDRLDTAAFMDDRSLCPGEKSTDSSVWERAALCRRKNQCAGLHKRCQQGAERNLRSMPAGGRTAARHLSALCTNRFRKDIERASLCPGACCEMGKEEADFYFSAAQHPGTKCQRHTRLYQRPEPDPRAPLQCSGAGGHRR